MQHQHQYIPVEGEQRANDQLEKCGKWLASIPRDDIAVLRHTAEFKEFLGAFERLGHAHLQVVVNSNSSSSNNNSSNNNNQGMETKEELPPEDEESKVFHGKTKTVLPNEKRKRSSNEISRRNNNLPGGVAAAAAVAEEGRHLKDNSLITTTSSTIINATMTISNGNNFLRFTDDILLRILEFLRCKCMIQASLTCSRFRQLVTKSAIQRTYEIARTRQLGNVMQLLRAKEQIYHIHNDSDDDDDNGDDDGDDGDDDGDDDMSDASNIEQQHRGLIDCSVPVPMLLPRRKILVTNAGDPEYNGIYYCTNCNGNGFVFTKPRFSSSKDYKQTIAQQQQQQQEGMIFDENPLRQNNNVAAIQRAGLLPLGNDNEHDDEGRFQIRQQQHQQHQEHQRALERFSEVSTKESFGSGLPLRCVIAKAYSNRVSIKMGCVRGSFFIDSVIG